jgi:hypothetical protein
MADEKVAASKEERDLQRLVEHRLLTALKLGFPLEDAELIASSSCDLHEIERLRGLGCPPGLTLQIVL